MALWMLNYVTLIAGGLAMETVLAIVGIAWLPFFLILWIIRESTCAVCKSSTNNQLISVRLAGSREIFS